MLLWVLLAGVAAYAVGRGRSSSAPSGLAEGAQELGLAEDGTFVLVETPPGEVSVGCATPPVSGAVVPGCAPGRDCCSDCRKGKIEVGYAAPGQSVVGTGQIHQLAAVLAQRIASGDPDAVRRAESIFSLALERGDLRARFVAEEITRAMDHYTPGSRAEPYAVHQRSMRRGIDNPNI